MTTTTQPGILWAASYRTLSVENVIRDAESFVLFIGHFVAVDVEGLNLPLLSGKFGAVDFGPWELVFPQQTLDLLLARPQHKRSSRNQDHLRAVLVGRHATGSLLRVWNGDRSHPSE